MRLLLTLLTAAALVAAIVACSDPFNPTSENIVGTYVLETLRTGTHDWVANGATIDLTLTIDGGTSGHLFMPGAGNGGADVDQDLSGGWMLRSDTLYFLQSPGNFNTFFPYMVWAPHKNRLVALQGLNGSLVRVVLRKRG
jgi:hypothetical protein